LAFNANISPARRASVLEITPADQADVHRFLLDHLQTERVVAVGCSAGGASAIELALRYPDRFYALLLIAAHLPGLPTRGDWFTRSRAVGVRTLCSRVPRFIDATLASSRTCGQAPAVLDGLAADPASAQLLRDIQTIAAQHPWPRGTGGGGQLSAEHRRQPVARAGSRCPSVGVR
jgi:pimeloyl-ACP methyl ester carboxylesterase